MLLLPYLAYKCYSILHWEGEYLVTLFMGLARSSYYFNAKWFSKIFNDLQFDFNLLLKQSITCSRSHFQSSWGWKIQRNLLTVFLWVSGMIKGKWKASNEQRVLHQGDRLFKASNPAVLIKSTPEYSKNVILFSLITQ